MAIDVSTGGLNLLATPAEVSLGAALGSAVGAVVGAAVDSGLDPANGGIVLWSSKSSRTAKPRDCPPGTVPIDEAGLDRDAVHDVKGGIGASPTDWVGIAPDDSVISGDEGGNAVNNGPWRPYTNRGPKRQR